MRTHRLRVAVALLVSAIGSTACDEGGSPAGPSPSPSPSPSPTLEPTFSSIAAQIFSSGDANGRSACTNCHTNAGQANAGGLNLVTSAAHAELVNVPSVTNPGRVRVVPGDPDNSLLIWKLEGRPGTLGARMPFDGPPFLTESQIQVIRQWIARGAPND